MQTERPIIRRPWALRPCPSDFVQTYIDGGWFAVELEYGARPSVIVRWINENGGEALRQARRIHMRNNRVKASVEKQSAARAGVRS